MNRRKFFKFAASTVAVAAVPSVLIPSGSSNTKDPLSFTVSDKVPREVMRIKSDGTVVINSSGPVGIGTTPPAVKLEVERVR